MKLMAKKLTIVIGAFEAQSIAIALEKEIKPPRPLTHDLFKNFAERFDIAVKQVIIHKLVDGVFYSSIICERDKIEDKMHVPHASITHLMLYLYYKNILDKGIYLKANSTETDKDSQEIDDILSNPDWNKEESNQSGRLYIKHSLQELSELLDQAVLQEDYEKAAKIRDEISRILILDV
jgi:uncharacterized protein YqgQ